jgi:DGQHR domain-containing protein
MSAIQVPAIEFAQGPHTLYQFVVEGKALLDFAAVSRIRRAEGELEGYQRPGIQSHIAAIAEYVAKADALLPNSVVLAFDPVVTFAPLSRSLKGQRGGGRCGLLTIPVAAEDEAKAAWVVDGQQRSMALAEAAREDFAVSVVGFVSDDPSLQRDQFILVNSTRPLPKGLIYELLPVAGEHLPAALERRRLPSLVAQRLNADADSPFRGLVRMPTNPDGVVQDNTLMKAVENSLSDGALFDFKPRGGEPDLEGMLALLKDYWSAVSHVFKDAWGLPPRKSRLMHGAGLVALSFTMDNICARHRGRAKPTHREFVNDLLPLAPFCRWTEGEWDFGGGVRRRWNDIENTGPGLRLITDYLRGLYREKVWNVKGDAA